MKPTEHTVSYGRKVQLDQFEPIDVHESITVDLEDDEDLEEVSKILSRVVHDNVERRIVNRVMQKKMEDGKNDGD